MIQKKFNDQFISYINCQIEENDFLLSKINPAGTLSKLEALEVYRDDYFARLKDVMNYHYPKSQSLLPETLWDDLLIDYIKHFPSTFKNLEDYGESLISEINDYQEELNHNFPYLKEMILLELNFKKLFHKKRLIGMNQNELKIAIEEDYEISLVSTLFLNEFNYNILENFSLDTPNLKNQMEFIMGIKVDDQIKFFNLSKSQFKFLKFFQTKNKMSLALEKFEDILTPLDLDIVFKLLANYQLIQKQ